MLKVLRDNLKYLSWILWGVIAVFVLFVFVDFGSVVPGAAAPSAAAATVGGQEVTFGEFRRAYQQTEDTYRQLYGEQFTPDLAKQMQLPLQVLNRLVSQKLLMLEARRMGLAVTDAELRRRILEIPGFTDAGGRFIGEQRYRQILRANGLTIEGFENGLREEILTRKLDAVLRAGLFIPEDAVEAAYRDEVERARIRFIELTPAQIEAEPQVDDETLAAYFEARREAFRLPERRVVSYLLVDLNRVREGLAVTDEELRSYYDQHTDEFTTEEAVRARHILLKVGKDRSPEQAEAALRAARRRIEAGEDFAAVAREISEDPGSRAAGGDLGFFGRGQMIREFEDAAFGAELGELVGPVRSAFGYHLLQVEERRAGGTLAFDAVRDRIRLQLLDERARRTAEERARALAARAAAGTSLESLASTDEAATLLVTEPFARDEMVRGIGRQTPFSVAAFQLAEGKVSEPVRVPRGWALLELREIRPPRLPELAEVEDEVRTAWVTARKRELVEERLKEARRRLDAGASLDRIARRLSLEIADSGEFGRQGPVGRLGAAPAVVEAAFDLEAGEVGGPVETPDGAVLFEVVERQRFDPEAFRRAREETLQRLRDQRANQLLTALVQKRRRETNVTYSPEVLQNFELDDRA